MAETSEASSPSAHSKQMDKKPVVVRVKRKFNHERVDAFWLEISERPAKRKLLDLEALSISDSTGKDAIKEAKPKRLFVQHVETITNSDAAKDVLQSYLPNCSGSKDLKTKTNERRSMLKQEKKQEQLRSVARQKHEDLGRSARFEQIWKSRRERMEADDNSLHVIFHLYDVVQVDIQDNNSRKAQKPEHIPVEDNTILCNYLPLLREYIASAAEEIESEMKSYAFNEESANDDLSAEQSARTEFVYDLYTVDDDADGLGDEATVTTYPLVQVNEEDDYYDGPSDSDYATDDSNAEDNPRNDYPEEESSRGEKDEDVDPYDYFNGYDSQNEDEEVDVSEEDKEDDEDWRWSHR